MRAQFPVVSQCIYLNTAYTGPLSLSLLADRRASDRHFLEQGDQYKKEVEKSYLKDAKQLLADFVLSKEENTFISSNFSFAFQSFLFLLPKEAHFLLLEEEYPSLTGIVEDFSFSSTSVSITEDVEEQVWEALHQNTFTVFALSAVQYTSGLMFDFAWLKKIKASFPDLIILVDGTQFVGAEYFNFIDSPVDALFGSSYKWIMAGYGTGYAIFKDECLLKLGINEQKINAIYDRGQIAVNAIGSLCTALRLIGKHDFFFHIAYKHQLNDRLKDELIERDLLAPWVAKRKQHSSIYNLRVSEEVYQELVRNDIRCIWRAGGVRIAIHYYNNQDDIDQFLSILDRLLEFE